ncbi:MAG: SIMPL domain-containing protein [Caldilineaceae bacterium]|nr:SIMPL domain-containing protein [Caldilineaceae bacterium]
MSKTSLRVMGAALLTLLLFAAIFLSAGAGWVNVPAVEAQESQPVISATVNRAITVVGEGKMSIEPDIARMTIGVETVKNTVKEASAGNKTTVEAVLAALKAQGIEKKDIQTSGFSIYAERFGPEGPLAEGDVRYRVSNNVMVVIRNLENVGTILDAAVEAGANNIYGVEFALDDPSAIESDARAKAIADARTKAEDIAGLSEVTLGQVLSVSEVIGSGGGFYAGNFAEQSRGGGGAPIQPGQLELVMQLQVVYAIGE